MDNRRVPSKLPAVTLGLWVIEILATTFDDSGGVTVSMTMDLSDLFGSVACLTALMILVALASQALIGMHAG